MKAISRWLDRFCYNHPNFGIPNLMKFIVIGNVLVYFLDMFSRGYVSWLFSFSSPLILQGQIWRIISFIFVPTSGYNPNDMFSILWCFTTTSATPWSGSGALPALPSSTVWAWC